MAYFADVVGIAFGLKELRHIRRQRVLLMYLLETLLVEKLQSKNVIMLERTFPFCTFHCESSWRLTSLL